MADKQPTGTVKTTTGVKFPTSDLPGTANPNPPKTDQTGVKGVDPASETGTPKQSEAPEKR